MPLAENFPNLTDLYGVGPLSGYLGGQQLDNARASQQINQVGALQDMFQKEQSLPVDLAYKQALTDQTGETTRGMKFKNDVNVGTEDMQRKAVIAKLSKEINEDDLKAAEASLNDLALKTTDPQTLQIVNALRSQMKDVWAERERIALQGDKEKDVARVRGDEQARVAQIRAQSRLQGFDFMSSLYKMKTAAQKYNTLNAEAVRIENDDPQLAAKYRAMAAEIEPQARAEISAVQPGRPDLGQMGIPATPPADIAPKSAPKTKLQGQAAEDWIGRAMKANPGMSREQVIAEGQKLGKL